MPEHGQLDPNELLYRRISLRNNPQLFDPSDRAVRHQAFIPNRKDVDGLTLIRAAHRRAEDVACPPHSTHRNYVVAVVRAGELMNLGLTLDITPDEIDRETGGTPAHVSVREMNAETYRQTDVVDWARQIAEHHIIEVHGPFPQDSIRSTTP